MMTHIGIGFAGGVLAFVHCLGMCGGFALHLSRTGRPLAVLGRQCLWHAGRIFTYAFLGALAGFGGGMLLSLPGLVRTQNVLAYIAGGVMILMGLILAGMPLPFRRRRSEREEGGLLVSLFRTFFQEPTAGGALALGLATGFLPCPIVWAFLAYAAQTCSVAAGIATMAAMGLGTAGALLLLGMTGHAIHLGLRRWGAVAAGIVLVFMGLATVMRGTETLHHLLGCPASPSNVRAADACCGAEMKKAE